MYIRITDMVPFLTGWSRAVMDTNMQSIADLFPFSLDNNFLPLRVISRHLRFGKIGDCNFFVSLMLLLTLK